jgi:hypothetical protein
MHSSLSSVSVLKYVGRSLVRKPISDPRSPTDIRNVFMAPEVSSELEQARWSNPWSRRKCKLINISIIKLMIQWFGVLITQYCMSGEQEATKWRSLVPTHTLEWRPEALGSPVRSYTPRSQTSPFRIFWFRTSAETLPTTIAQDLINTRKTWNILNDNGPFLPAATCTTERSTREFCLRLKISTISTGVKMLGKFVSTPFTEQKSWKLSLSTCN